MKNQVHLIAYADRFGGTLQGLRALLEGPFAGLFGGVHVLPFFEPIDGADAGFDPIDHTRVDARLGGWGDVAAVAAAADVTADVIVNHISRRSAQFLDFLEQGERSRFAEMFVTYAGVFPDGASEGQLAAIYRLRGELPFTPIRFADGAERFLWTTFSPEQIDIDVRHPRAVEYLDGIVRVLAANGVSTVRLDAAGFTVKKAGTSCFMIDETLEFIGAFTERVRSHGMEVLVEVHAHHETQVAVARLVDWVYDFALPPLVLHACFNGTARYLKRWIEIRPTNVVTVLDTHDGIGVPDIGADEHDPAGRPGFVPEADLPPLVERIHANSRGGSRRASGAAAENLDLLHVNCTFYDALGRDDRGYLLCRAIQFLLPGVPQVYYVGLLAGENDMGLLERTSVGRDVNRHYYTRDEIDAAIARPVVARLFELIRLRNEHAAFAGSFESAAAADDTLELRWTNGEAFVRLAANLATLDYRLEYSAETGTRRFDSGVGEQSRRSRC